MLSEKVEKALNAQINAEFWSAYLYLSMSADAMQKGYKGIANWFSIQFQEEQAHAQIFVNYVLSRGGKVTLRSQPLKLNGLHRWRCSRTRCNTNRKSPH